MSDEQDFLSLHALFAPGSQESSSCSPAAVSSSSLFVSSLLSPLCSPLSLCALDVCSSAAARLLSSSVLVAALHSLAVERPLAVALLLRRARALVRTDRTAPLAEAVAASPRVSALELLLLQENEAANSTAPHQQTLPAVEMTPPIKDFAVVPPAGGRVWELMHPHALAAQMTALEEMHMRELTLSDIAHGFSLSDAGRSYAHWLARCPLWVATEIVASEDKPRAIVYFLKVVVQLLEIRNLASLQLVMEGLNHESVQRLSLAWEGVLDVHADSWEWLQQSVLPSALKTSRRPPFIPCVKLIQSEVWQILFEEQTVAHSKQDHIMLGDCAVNWTVEERILGVVKPWLDASRKNSFRYGIVPHAQTIEMLKSEARVLTAGQLGLLSRQHQPENQTLSDAVRSAGGLVSGFSSWLKSSPSSPPTAAEESRRSLTDAIFLPGGDWSEVFSKSETLKLVQKTAILEAGTVNSTLWRVKRGAVSVVSSEGFIVGTLGEGQVFGEIAMIQSMGVVVQHAIVVVSPVCEVQKVSFTTAAAILRVRANRILFIYFDFFFFFFFVQSMIQLRVSFYMALCCGMSTRGFDLNMTTVGIPDVPVDQEKPDKSQKFFSLFDMKGETVERKFLCSCVASPRVTFFCKLFVTRRVVAVHAHVFSSTFRFVEPLLSCIATQVNDTSVKLEGAHQSLILNVDSPAQVLELIASLRDSYLANKLEAPVIPTVDNRSWNFLVMCGLRHVHLHQGQVVPAGELAWVTQGQCICRETGQLCLTNTSFGESSFFGDFPSTRWPRIEALSERVDLLLLSPQFLKALSLERPDVGSNLLRSESVVLAYRLVSADSLARCAMSLTGLDRK